MNLWGKERTQMNKEDFLRELSAELADLPEKDREDAIKYYSDYIDDAGYDADTVISELGTPKSVAATVRSEAAAIPEAAPVENPLSTVSTPSPVAAPSRVPDKRRLPAWVIVVLTILSPVIFVVCVSILCLLLSIAALLAGATLASLAAGILMIVAGFSVLWQFTTTGFLTLGGGFSALAFSALFLILSALYFGKFLPLLVRCIFFSGKRKNKKEVAA